MSILFCAMCSTMRLMRFGKTCCFHLAVLPPMPLGVMRCLALLAVSPPMPLRCHVVSCPLGGLATFATLCHVVSCPPGSLWSVQHLWCRLRILLVVLASRAEPACVLCSALWSLGCARNHRYPSGSSIQRQRQRRTARGRTDGRRAGERTDGGRTAGERMDNRTDGG